MWMLSLLISLSARADDCDARALIQELKDATAANAGAAFSALVDCSPEAALKSAHLAFDDMNASHDGYLALVQAVQIGVRDPAVVWVDGLQSDSRSHAISALGKACVESSEIQGFFVDRAEVLGTKFWDQRWYKALSRCPAEPVRDLLWGKLSKGVESDLTLYFGVLEVYALSAGAHAIPRIEELINGTNDAEIQSNLVAAFVDAAQLGSSEGSNSEVIGAAVASILSVADQLQPKALSQARRTLLALDAEQESDELAAILFKDLAQKEGDFIWAAIVVETATCKNGKITQRAQVATVRENGNTWGDQILEKVEASVRASWTLDLAERCRGKGEVTTLVPSAPFEDKAARNEWVDAQIKEVRLEGVKKFIRVDNGQILI